MLTISPRHVVTPLRDQSRINPPASLHASKMQAPTYIPTTTYHTKRTSSPILSTHCQPKAHASISIYGHEDMIRMRRKTIADPDVMQPTALKVLHDRLCSGFCIRRQSPNIKTYRHEDDVCIEQRERMIRRQSPSILSTDMKIFMFSSGEVLADI